MVTAPPTPSRTLTILPAEVQPGRGEEDMARRPPRSEVRDEREASLRAWFNSPHVAPATGRGTNLEYMGVFKLRALTRREPL